MRHFICLSLTILILCQSLVSSTSIDDHHSPMTNVQYRNDAELHHPSRSESAEKFWSSFLSYLDTKQSSRTRVTRSSSPLGRLFNLAQDLAGYNKNNANVIGNTKRNQDHRRNYYALKPFRRRQAAFSGILRKLIGKEMNPGSGGPAPGDEPHHARRPASFGRLLMGPSLISNERHNGGQRNYVRPHGNSLFRYG